MAKQSAGRRLGVADFKKFLGEKTGNADLIRNGKRAGNRATTDIQGGRIPFDQEEQIEYVDYIRFEDVFITYEQHVAGAQLNAVRILLGIASDIEQTIEAERNYARSLSHPMVYERAADGSLKPRPGRTLRESVAREIEENAEIGAVPTEDMIEELTSLEEAPVDISDKGERVEEPPSLLNLFGVMDRAEHVDDAIDPIIVPALIQNADAARYMEYGATEEDPEDPVARETGLPQYMELTHDEYRHMAEPRAKYWSKYIADHYKEVHRSLELIRRYRFLARVVARFMGIPDVVDAMASPENMGYATGIINHHNAAIEDLKRATMIRRTLPDIRSRTLNVGEGDDYAAEASAGPVDDREYVDYARSMLLDQLQTIEVPEDVPQAIVNKAARKMKHEDLASTVYIEEFLSREYPRSRQ